MARSSKMICNLLHNACAFEFHKFQPINKTGSTVQFYYFFAKNKLNSAQNFLISKSRTTLVFLFTVTLTILHKPGLYIVLITLKPFKWFVVIVSE